MIPKYTIEYAPRHHAVATPARHDTDDPVATLAFLEMLLEGGARITAIKHEGAALAGRDFDKLIKTAAGMLAARHVCVSLGIAPEEERFRFGFAA
jgi:hypothetical protein